MTRRVVSSWGNVVRAEHAILQLAGRHAPFPDIAPLSSVLPYGNGRSYGDSCLNCGAGLIEMRSLDRFIGFDAREGTVSCEAGVLLADILRLAVPQGWFLPVTPGTRFVTVGGAIANDVHGKNHHHAGTFARHVRRFELLRSDGTRLICSDHENVSWWKATIGGLGLTGVITWAEIRLRPIAGPWMDVEAIRFGDLDEFVGLCVESDQEFEYTVAWVDCLARGRHLGRGVFQRAHHAGAEGPTNRAQPRPLSIPFTPPVSLVNRTSLRVFNAVKYHGQRGARRSIERIESFFYPLDGILHWNRLYGRRGLYQYQCVVPDQAGGSIRSLLRIIAHSGIGSPLAVLKRFGAMRSAGLLSFPSEGITLALDFPNLGMRVQRLFRELDAVVRDSGGRLYPAKDARMPGNLFRTGYPLWEEFSRYIDPKASSSFWRRVMDGT